jgi:hypothetical protein
MNETSLAIMQPYVFPYVGYFHLIESSDMIVFYDDVNYIKRGWINRNRILLNHSDFMFTIPLEKASQNKLINEIKPIIDSAFKNKFFAQIEAAYKKAPYYKEVLELLSLVFSKQQNNIADLAINSIILTYDFLGKEIKWAKSSILSPETKGLDKADRLIQINKQLGFSNYNNPIGGKELYSIEYFKNNDINLGFIESKKNEYKQFQNDFVNGLSIIDILMFNDIKLIDGLFNGYKLLK